MPPGQWGKGLYDAKTIYSPKMKYKGTIVSQVLSYILCILPVPFFPSIKRLYAVRAQAMRTTREQPGTDHV